jgi:hypothetical protein
VEASPIIVAQGGSRGLGLADLKRAWSAAGVSAGSIRAMEGTLAMRAGSPDKELGFGIEHRLPQREYLAMQDTYRRTFAPELELDSNNCALYVNYVLLQSGIEPLGEPGGPGRASRNYASAPRAYQAALERGATRVTNLADVQDGDVAFALFKSRERGGGTTMVPFHTYVAVSVGGHRLFAGQDGETIQLRDLKTKFIQRMMHNGELHILRLPR